jgi:hypothetical protein
MKNHYDEIDEQIWQPFILPWQPGNLPMGLTKQMLSTPEVPSPG